MTSATTPRATSKPVAKAIPKPSQEPKAELPPDPAVVAKSIPDKDGPVWVTPELAKLWLTRNADNRPMRQTRIMAMAGDMAHGRWAYTGESIKFSRTGRLMDGQHRLTAVVRSGETCKFLVVLNIADEAQAFMDTGAKRSAADALTFRGEMNTTNLGATVRFAILVETRRAARRDGVTHAEIVEWIKKHPDIRRHVGVSTRYANRLDIKPSVLGYAMWRLAKIDEETAELFFSDIVEMRTDGAGDPIYTLLSRFRTARRNRERLTAVTELSFIFRAWNAVRAGKELRILKVLANDRDLPEPK